MLIMVKAEVGGQARSCNNTGYRYDASVPTVYAVLHTSVCSVLCMPANVIICYSNYTCIKTF